MKHSSIHLFFSLGLLSLVACSTEVGAPTDKSSDTGSTDADDTSDNDDDTSETTIETPIEEISCDLGSIEAAPEGECVYTQGTGAGLLLIGDVLEADTITQNGGVFIDDDTIDCVGCDCLSEHLDASRIVCNGASISPGLINTHDHMGWMGGEPYVASEAGEDPMLRYEHRHDWRRGKRGHPSISQDKGEHQGAKSQRWGEMRFALGGTTSINGSGSVDGFLRNLDRNNAMEGLNADAVEYDTFPLGDSSGDLRSDNCNYSLPSANAFINESAYTPHVAEGIDIEAQNEFLCLSTDGYGGVDALSGNTAIIHGVGVTASDVQVMAADGMKLIWSPRSNISLYGETAPVTMYHRLGVPIALGTDWVLSGSMNTNRELACADYLNSTHYDNYFSYRDLWAMVTINGAIALNVSDQIGALSAGKIADIAIFKQNGLDPYEAVVKGDLKDVALVLRGGDVLNGDAALVDALSSGCDNLDVCGVEKSICAEAETGKTFSEIEGELPGIYPLFFCDTPENEPTCVPYRGEGDSVEGSTLYTSGPSSNDSDGDGIDNSADNCPNIFNPTRPVDFGIQSDFDEDGVGDACDVCPMDADTTNCESFDPNDLDRDGIPDSQDNCPGTANPDQADGDNDGTGDVCDECPTTATGNHSAPYDIYDLQEVCSSNHPPEGTTVSISCAVTAIKTNSQQNNETFWCQDRQGGAHSGLYIFSGSNQGSVSLGDDVELQGTYEEYYGVAELTNVTISSTSSGAMIAPLVLDPANIGDPEEYEGMLIRVENVSVTAENADTNGDYDEFQITGGMRVDDFIWNEMDNNYAVGTGFSSITGILHYSFDNYKIVPRNESDLVLQ